MTTDPVARGLRAISSCTRIDQLEAARRYFDLALRRRSNQIPQSLVVFFARAARARARAARRRLLHPTTTAEVAA